MVQSVGIDSKRTVNPASAVSFVDDVLRVQDILPHAREFLKGGVHGRGLPGSTGSAHLMRGWEQALRRYWWSRWRPVRKRMHDLRGVAACTTEPAAGSLPAPPSSEQGGRRVL